MELISFDLTGAAVQVLTPSGGEAPAVIGIVGVDVAARRVEAADHTAVQVLLDDDQVGFDRTLLDGPIVVELVDASGTVVAREPLDHDRFRRRLKAEHDVGQTSTRGVLVLTDGELPPPWIRLAFLPVPLAATAGTRLVLRRTTVADLITGVESAHASGELTDDQRRTALQSIEQRHPDWN